MISPENNQYPWTIIATAPQIFGIYFFTLVLKHKLYLHFYLRVCNVCSGNFTVLHIDLLFSASDV
jgi:hypothetical protein